MPPGLKVAEIKPPIVTAESGLLIEVGVVTEGVVEAVVVFVAVASARISFDDCVVVVSVCVESSDSTHEREGG